MSYRDQYAQRRDRLARVLAGIAPQEPPPVQSIDFSPAIPQFPAYTGLRNDMTLPAFEAPGASLPIENYMPQQQAQPVPTQPPQMSTQMPPPQMPMAGGQGFAGPEPAPGSMPTPYDHNLDPRYLPEQWRGRFTGWG